MTLYIYQLDFEPATNSRSGLIASYTLDFSVDINWLFNNRGSYNTDNDSGSSIFIDNSFNQDGVTVYAGANELVRFVPPYAQQMLTIEGYATFLVQGGSGQCDIKIYNEPQPENLFQRTDSISSFLQSPAIYGAVKGDLLVIDLLGRFLPANNSTFLNNNSATYFDAGGAYAPPLTATSTVGTLVATYLRDDVYRQAVLASSTSLVFDDYQGVGQAATKQSFTQDISVYKTWAGTQPNVVANVVETNLYYWIACYRTAGANAGTLLLRVAKADLSRTAIVAINNSDYTSLWAVGGTPYNCVIYTIVDDYDTDQVSILANGGIGLTANYYHFRFNGTLITSLSPLLFTRGNSADPGSTMFVYNEGGLAFILDTNTTPRLFALDPQTQTIIATQALTGITAVAGNKYTLAKSALAPVRFGSLLVFSMRIGGNVTLVSFNFDTRTFSTLTLDPSNGEPWMHVHNDELLVSFLGAPNVLTVTRVNSSGSVAGSAQLTLTSPQPLMYVFYDPRGYLFLQGNASGVGICVYDVEAKTLTPYTGSLPSSFTASLTAKFFVPPIDTSTNHGTLAALITGTGNNAPTALASFPRTIFGVYAGGPDIAVTGEHSVNTSYEPTSRTFDFNMSNPVGNRGLVFRNQVSLRGLQS